MRAAYRTRLALLGGDDEATIEARKLCNKSTRLRLLAAKRVRQSVVAANARRVRVQSASSWALHLLGVPQHQRNSSSHLVAEMRV